MIKLFNSLTHKLEEFKPIKPAEVGFYICGPTVYDYAHIGNLRSMILGDLIRRVLEYNYFQVKQVMNITDVDDKTIRESKKEGVSLSEFTRKYERIFSPSTDWCRW